MGPTPSAAQQSTGGARPHSLSVRVEGDVRVDPEPVLADPAGDPRLGEAAVIEVRVVDVAVAEPQLVGRVRSRPTHGAAVGDGRVDVGEPADEEGADPGDADHREGRHGLARGAGERQTGTADEEHPEADALGDAQTPTRQSVASREAARAVDHRTGQERHYRRQTAPPTGTARGGRGVGRLDRLAARAIVALAVAFGMRRLRHALGVRARPSEGPEQDQ